MPLSADGIRFIAAFRMQWQRRERCAIAVFSTPPSLLFTYKPLCLYCLALSLGFTRVPILFFLAARIRVGPSAPILLSAIPLLRPRAELRLLALAAPLATTRDAAMSRRCSDSKVRFSARSPV